MPSPTPQRTARRDRHCDACSGPIAAGETYYAIEWKPWDHPDNEGYGAYGLHLDCAEAHELVNRDAGPMDDWISPADTLAYINDCVHDDASQEVADAFRLRLRAA